MAKRGRPKKVKIEDNLTKSTENLPETVENGVETDKNDVKDDPMLPNKSLFRIDEVMQYFGIAESTVRLWIDHGHLTSEKIVGSTRVTRDSILRCRFGNIKAPPTL